MVPRMLRGPVSSRLSVALSSFCRESLTSFIMLLVLINCDDGAVAVVNFLENLVEVGHGPGGLVVAGIVIDDLAQRALAGLDLGDDVVGVGQKGVRVVRRLFDVGGGALQIADGGEGGDVQLVAVDESAHRSLPLGDAVGNDLGVVEGGGDIGLVILDKLGEGPEQLVYLFAAEALGQVFHAAWPRCPACPSARSGRAARRRAGWRRPRL